MMMKQHQWKMGGEHYVLIADAGYDADTLCNKDLGDYFFQLNEWYAVAQVAVRTDAKMVVTAYHFNQDYDAYAALASSTVNSSNIDVDVPEVGNLYITRETADSTRTITVTWYPKNTPSSISDLENSDQSQLCDLMTFEYGGDLYCIGFNYFGCHVFNHNNDEIVKWGSPIVSLKPYLQWSADNAVTKDFEPFYVKGPDSRFANGLRVFYNLLDNSREPFPKTGNIIITIPTNLLDIDYTQCYLTMTMVQIPISELPIGCATDWVINGVAKDDGITVFDSDWVDYVHQVYSGYLTEDELTTYGIFGANLYNLREFSEVSQDEYPWFMTYEFNQNDATININLSIMIGQGYSGEWSQQTDFSATLYISLIYQGQIYAWAYCPYGEANAANADTNACSLTATHTGTAMQLNLAGSDYADYEVTTVDSEGNRDSRGGLIIKQNAV